MSSPTYTRPSTNSCGAKSARHVRYAGTWQCAHRGNVWRLSALKDVKYIETGYATSTSPTRSSLVPILGGECTLRGQKRLCMSRVTASTRSGTGTTISSFSFSNRHGLPISSIVESKVGTPSGSAGPAQLVRSVGRRPVQDPQGRASAGRGQPNGTMHHATIEFGRSIPRIKGGEPYPLPQAGTSAGFPWVKYWRNASGSSSATTASTATDVSK